MVEICIRLAEDVTAFVCSVRRDCVVIEEEAVAVESPVVEGEYFGGSEVMD